MKATKCIAILICVCFSLFMAVLFCMGVHLGQNPYSYYENRSYAQKPVLNLQNALDGTFFSQTEKYVQDRSWGRNTLIKLKTFLDLYALHRPVVNDVAVTERALLRVIPDETVSETQIREKATVIASNLKAHTEQVEAYGGTFVYVAIPCQYVCYENEYPDYLYNRAEYTALETGILFSLLDDLGVDYLDMGRIFDQLGGREEFSSAVDNHFGLNGYYTCYRSLMEHLNTLGFRLEVLDESNSSVVTLENPYLGSRNRKLFGLWHCDEKISLIEPDTPPVYTRLDHGQEIRHSINALPKDSEEEVLYSLFMHGDLPQTQIITDRPELPRILIYGDSFTNALESVLWYSFDEMDSLDFRHYKDQTLEEYIQEFQPDIVVCIRDYESLLAPGDNGQ